MTQRFDTKLKIKSWDEKPYRELADGSKFSRADVVLDASDVTSGEGADAVTGATFDALLYYRPDGTSSYVSLIHVTATLGGRSGSFVLQGDGQYDGTTAESTLSVLVGSGTAGLAGMRGSAHSASPHDDYPYFPLQLHYEVG